MNNLEINYKIKKRAELIVKEKGSINNDIKHIKTELSEFESMWSKYSCDCLGHGITCDRLLINYLEQDSITI